MTLYRLMRRLGLALAATAAPSFAVPVMDMRVEDLMPMGQDFVRELNLNANQQTLWRQLEAKTRQLMRERQSRRERLQAALGQGLAAQRVELRELLAALEAETAASSAEQSALRQWWLTLNDALDEHQRQAVATFLATQLERVADAPPAHGAQRGRADGGAKGRGGRQKQGGAGMPGF